MPDDYVAPTKFNLFDHIDIVDSLDVEQWDQKTPELVIAHVRETATGLDHWVRVEWRQISVQG